MNRKKLLACLLIIVSALFVCYGFKKPVNLPPTEISGAWRLQDQGSEHVVIFSGGYFMHSQFDKAGKTFQNARGGTYKLENNQIKTQVEFDSEDKDMVGQAVTYPYSFEGQTLVIDIDGTKTPWEKIDAQAAPLAGVWRSAGHMEDGKITYNTPGPRKTYKVLSGTRFQWAQMNTDTKEFLGTGGGTYTFENGKYTENIEFFSRDNGKVGVSLPFDDKVEKDEWHHTGLNSKGEKIYEVWAPVK
jgi:hypothetical protein